MTPFSRLVPLALAAVASTGCGSLAPPFNDLKGADMTVYRLQNFEPPAQAQATPAPGAFPIPPQIQQWITAGASLLPPGLLPPGLLPGTAAPTPAPPDAPRFHGFRILEWRQVSDAGVKGDIVDTFGHSSNFTTPQFSCMYAELGFAIAQPSGQPADILASLSCQQVQAFNFAWPYQQTGIAPDTEKKLAQVAQKVFAGR
jgi:hypothetical protein